MYSYDDLFLFTKVVEIGSFIHTAKILKISHTTISRRIKALEDRLGVILLRVNTKNFELTALGQQVYEALKNQAVLVDDALADILEHQREAHGTLHVVLPSVLALDLITPQIPSFLRRYPRVNLKLSYKNKEIDMIKEGIDVAIINHLPRQQTQKIRNIFSANALLYCTEDYVQKYGIPSTPAELAQHLVTGYLQNSYDTPANISLMHKHSGESVVIPMPKRILSDSGLHNLRMLESGEVIAGVFDYVALNHLNYELVPVLPDYQLFTVKYYLLRHPQHDDLKIQVFCQFLDDCFKSQR